MPIRPEHLKRRLSWTRREVRLTGKAADLLESIIDQRIYANADELVHGALRFPLADGTNREVVGEIVQRYSSVGWEVDVVHADGVDCLSFRLPQPQRARTSEK